MNPQRRVSTALVLLTLLACPSAWSQQQFLPVDQAPTQPDFFSFRAQLIATLARRDVPALLDVVHQNIKNSFGGNDGTTSSSRCGPWTSPTAACGRNWRKCWR